MSPKFKSQLQKIKKDWEKLFFWLMLGIAVIFFINFFIQVFFYRDPTPQFNVKGSSLNSIFGDNAFAFLYGVPLLDDDETPFNLQKQFPKIKTTVWVPPKDKKPPPPPKPKPKNGHNILFSGWLTVSSGEKVAFVKVFDFRSSKLLDSNTVKIGESINGFYIKEISDEAITVTTEDGRSATVPIYEQITIMEP